MNISNHRRFDPKRPRLVSVVTETFPPEVNGVANSIARFCGGLIERGVRLQIVRPRQPGESEPWHCPQAEHLLVRGLNMPSYPQVRFGRPSGRKLAQWWRHERPDLVHVVTEGPLGWSAARVATRLGIPVTSSFHTNFHGYASHYGAGIFTRAVMGYLRHFHNATRLTIVPTTQLRNELGALGFQNLAVVGRGVDAGRFNPARRSQSLRASFGASADSPVILHVGRLAAEKNLKVMFESFAGIRRARSDARFVIVGDGPELSRLANEYPDCHFAGMLTGDALAEHYASADLFLYPSLTETFGNVTLEAMASGLVVVAYDYAAAREHIRSMENGVSVPFGDAKQFAEMASTIARSPGRMQLLRREARATALQLNWDRLFDLFLDTLSGACSTPMESAATIRPAGSAAAA